MDMRRWRTLTSMYRSYHITPHEVTCAFRYMGRSHFVTVPMSRQTSAARETARAMISEVTT
jgi:hypothetical protein